MIVEFRSVPKRARAAYLVHYMEIASAARPAVNAPHEQISGFSITRYCRSLVFSRTAAGPYASGEGSEGQPDHVEYTAQEIEALVGEFERLEIELFKLRRRIEARQRGTAAPRPAWS